MEYAIPYQKQDELTIGIHLANKLLHQQTHLLRTATKNKNYVPKDVTQTTKIKIGSNITTENYRGIIILKWKNKQNIIILSTKHSTKQQKFSTGASTTKAKGVIDYKKENLQLTCLLVTPVIWYRVNCLWYRFRKLSVKLLTSTSMINAHILYK